MSIGERLKKVLWLYWEFFKIGLFTFGGGWGIIAQIQQKFVDGRKLITNADLLDMTSIGKSLPGLMVANASFLFGHRVGGTLCGMACALGFATPPAIILTIIAYVYAAVNDNIMVIRAMAGVRGTIVPILVSAALIMQKSGANNKRSLILAFIAFVVYLFTPVSPFIIIIGGGLMGIILTRGEEV